MTDYGALARFMLERIVDRPEAITVNVASRGRTTMVEIGVDEDDKGQVIGKGGRNIEALRALVRAAGLRRQERVQLELADVRGPAGTPDMAESRG